MRLLKSYLSTLTSHQTRRAYRTDLRSFFSEEDHVEPSSVDAMDVEDVLAFVRTMRDLGRSEGTQQRRLAALRSFFDWTIKEGILDRNPARHPDVGPMVLEDTSSSARYLVRSEARQLLESAGQTGSTGLRNQAIILVIIFGALRRSDVVGIEVEDIRPLGQYWILDLDGNSMSGSYVRIPDQVVRVIETVQDTYAISSGPLWRSMSNRNRGEPMTPDAIYSIVRRAGNAADVGPVSIETLRRTGLQLAAAGGADVSQIQAHGRFGTVGSAARVRDSDSEGARLSDSAAEYIKLDALDLLADG